MVDEGVKLLMTDTV